MKEKDNKVLLHSCCAICSGQPIRKLRELGYEPVVFFFNPNIHPHEEFEKRLEAQKKLCYALKCELIIEDDMSGLYGEIMCGYENHEEGSERCSRCFEFRLLRTVQKAKELGIETFTTSISISPHKNFEKIKEIGYFFAEHFKVNFLDIDFRKENGNLATNMIAKGLDLYRQNYCGCEVSMKRLKKENKQMSQSKDT